MSALLQRGVSVEWETPPEIFLPLDAEFGFTLDAAASHANRKCDLFFTREEDALSRPWRGVVWLNPPYGQREIPKWIRKAYESARDGATVVCFVPARTDAGWWHDYALKGEVRFVRGRVGFVRDDGRRSSAPFPSAIVVFRPERERDRAQQHLPLEVAR